jgi:hypothetical protein
VGCPQSGRPRVDSYTSLTAPDRVTPPGPEVHQRSILARRPWLFLAALAGLAGLTVLAEFRSVLRPDVAFLLYAARRVLDGARLYIDVVEINPPLIVAVNLPAVLLARLFGISAISAYRLMVLLVVLLSVGASGAMLRHIVRSDGSRRWLVLLVALVLLPMPAADYGEREHLLLAVLLPYVWLVCLRVTGYRPRPLAAAVIGAGAGLGLALKPYFLITWLALELYRRLRVDRRLAAPAPEITAVLAVLVGYGVSCLVFTPQYFALIGMLGGAYSRFLREPLGRLLVTAPGVVLVLLAVLAYVALRRWAQHPALWDLLLLASVSLFLGGLLQQKGLRYQFYPSFGVATVVLGLAALDVRALVPPLTARIYRVVATAAVCTIGIVALETSVLHAVHRGWGARRDAPFSRLVAAVREHAAGGSIMVMSYNLGSSFPLVNYAGVESASRFPHLWILAAEYLDRLHADAPLHYREAAEMGPAERYVMESVVADVARHRPQLLLVLRNARDDKVNGLRRLDYLAYFGRDPRFARLLDHYERSESVGEYAIYRRLAPGEARTAPPPAPTPGTLDVLVNQRGGVQHLPRRRGPYVAGAVFVLALVWSSAVELHRARKGARTASDPSGESAGP